MSPLDRVLGRLTGVSPNGRSACCPAHDDRHASLSIAQGNDGRVLLKCHAGCPVETLLDAMGLEVRDLFVQTDGGRRVEATYAYLDEESKLLFEVVRYAPKGFTQRRPDGAGGWIYNLHGVQRVLYRLPQLLSAPGRAVFVVEGEKDADALAELGFVATTNPGGAGKWRAKYSEALRDWSVYIVPDNDEGGELHARDVARGVLPVAQEVRIVRLPDLSEKGDVSDWIAAGGTADELRRFVRATKPIASADVTERPSHAESDGPLVLLSEVTPEDVSWLWPGKIPLGKLSILEGDPDTGKTTVALDIAARLSSGRSMPCEGVAAPPAGVVIITAEDGLADTIRPRLEAAGADLQRIAAFRLDSLPDLTASGLAAIEAAIRRVDARLVIVDPLVAFLPDQADSKTDHRIRRVLTPLAGLAERTGVAVLALRHLNKSDGNNPKYRGGGSIGFTAAARSVMLAGVDPGEEARRVLARVKGNLAPPWPSISYELEAGDGAVRVVWGAQVEWSAADVLRSPTRDAGDGPADRHAVDDASDFLTEVLNAGWRSSKQIKKEAGQAGIAWRTVERAKTKLGQAVKAKRYGGDWGWELVRTDEEHRHHPLPVAEWRSGGLGEKPTQIIDSATPPLRHSAKVKEIWRCWRRAGTASKYECPRGPRRTRLARSRRLPTWRSSADRAG